MTKVTFEEKYYPAVKETVYKTQLSNGLTVSLLPVMPLQALLRPAIFFQQLTIY